MERRWTEVVWIWWSHVKIAGERWSIDSIGVFAFFDWLTEWGQCTQASKDVIYCLSFMRGAYLPCSMSALQRNLQWQSRRHCFWTYSLQIESIHSRISSPAVLKLVDITDLATRAYWIYDINLKHRQSRRSSTRNSNIRSRPSSFHPCISCSTTFVLAGFLAGPQGLSWCYERREF